MRPLLLSTAVLPFVLLLAVPAAAATSPQSKACSDQATAKDLHGAEREAFRADCLKAAGPAPAANAAPAPAPAAKAAPATPKATSSASAASPQSKACSDQATAKGLHGAEREAFRADCMKGAPAKSTAAPAAKPTAALAAKPTAAPAAKPTAAPPAAKTAPATGGASAQSPASKACSDQATAKGLHGADREAFRTQCLKGASPIAAAAPAAAPAAKPAAKPATAAIPPEPRANAAKPAAAPGTRTPAQQAADQRIHDCGQQWQAAKAANRIPAGQTWPQYWSACSARMKAAGK